MRPGAEADPIYLSALEFDVACESERLTDRRHIVLDVPSPGATYAERARLVAGVWDELRQRGLAETGRDRLDVEFADVLALLDRPQRGIDLRIWADRSIRALACASADAGVLVIVDGDVVEITPIRSGALADAAVSVAGDTPPGPGRAVSLPNDTLRQAASIAGTTDRLAFTDELRAAGIPHSDAADVAAMSAGMTVRGQLGAEANPDRGRPERAERVVAFHDTEQGRYLHVVRHTGDGRGWSTIAPASNARLAEYAGDLLAEVRRD
ncbi:ESX secretion-associated protein EspG [Saccharopolyspora halophila]|uniref:ESX secretion-associated protein EspG n=1 Tax=Saccharopolyspora halophila TaxID=405551 RepID=A0ABN3GNY7_9PSEU